MSEMIDNLVPDDDNVRFWPSEWGTELLVDTPQWRCFQAIKALIAQKGIPPTIDELRISLGYQSTSTPHRLVKWLQEAGVIERSPGEVARGLRVSDGLRRFDGPTRLLTPASALTGPYDVCLAWNEATQRFDEI